MINGNYQRRYLRAPYKEDIIYADGAHALKASTLNISEMGLLVDHLPSFPDTDEVPLMFSLGTIPHLKNLNLYKLQTFSPELFESTIIRARAKMVRREQLSQDLDNIFKSRFGLEFVRIFPQDQQKIKNYVETFASNLVYLQTLIDSYNSDDETKLRTRALARILGYKSDEKIAKLRMEVSLDYKSLQWL